MTKLMMNGTEARAFLGLGENKFRRLVHKGVIPCWQDPDTGFRHFARDALIEWAREAGLGHLDADPTPPHGIERGAA